MYFQAIPSMLLALVFCFDHRKSRDSGSILDIPLPKEDISSPKGFKYIWYALSGYSVGLVTALSAGILTHSPQPALLYLVCYFDLLFLHEAQLSPPIYWRKSSSLCGVFKSKPSKTNHSSGWLLVSKTA